MVGCKTQKAWLVMAMGAMGVAMVMLGVVVAPAQAQDQTAVKPPVIWLQTAQADTGPAVGQVARGPHTGLPLPRFASLRPDQVNARTGPGLSYPIDWIYQRAGLPVEITAEFDTWRRIRDREQTESWVHQSMLSGRRGALVTDSEVTLLSAPDPEARPVARLQADVVGTIKGCNGEWCEIDVGDYSGWLMIQSFFGAYPGEDFR